VSVVPTVSPFFEPKAVYLFGIDPAAPGTNLRFTVGAVTVGGSPQLAINTLTPGGGGAGSPAELLSDVFNRSAEPLSSLASGATQSPPSTATPNRHRGSKPFERVLGTPRALSVFEHLQL